MDTSLHTLPNLFLQLGLKNDEHSMSDFIRHNQLFDNEPLQNAHIWTPAQAAFIEECLAEDSDWAEVVDQLNVQLHG
jgi:hypothetical protein